MHYELLDFGQGRKLERLGAAILDRPAPAALGVRCVRPELWPQADARFDLPDESPPRSAHRRGRWTLLRPLPKNWTIGWTMPRSSLTFTLRTTEFGHVGLFPEQADNWRWIVECIRRAGRSLRVLNLFAYTGGSTLAAAAAGAEVVHVDASRSTVAWARRNAEASGLVAAPIRWLVEDARKFVAREIKRGHRYDAIILDPPSYGHGAAGQAWKLDRDLPALLEACAELTRAAPAFMLLSCHSPGFGPPELAAQLSSAFPGHECAARDIEADDLMLSTGDGRQLHSGTMARFYTGAWSPS